MDLIPHDEIKLGHPFNLAPMIDFLFLMLALFATLAISRAALFDSDITLASINNTSSKTSTAKRDLHQINLSISAAGQYKWLTEFQEYGMKDVQAIQQELIHQHQIGALASDKTSTEVLLHIDQRAPWRAIAEAIFAIRETGFTVHPVYENASSR